MTPDLIAILAADPDLSAEIACSGSTWNVAIRDAAVDLEEPIVFGSGDTPEAAAADAIRLLDLSRS